MLISTKTGEPARESGLIRCKRCQTALSVTQGQAIPICPNCGFDQFDAKVGPGLPV